MTTENQLITSVNGHWAKKEMTYTGGGQVETLEYTDLFGNPVDIAGNYASLVNIYDDRGLLTSTSYYDKSGKLSTDARMISGVLVGDRFHARIEFEYDDNGNAVETRYYDEDGKLTEEQIYSIEKTEYDVLGRPVHLSYFDSSGNPATDYSTDLYFTFDDCSNLIGIRPMSGDKRDYILVEGREFVYGEEFSFDEQGNQTEEVYLNQDGSIQRRKVTVYNRDGLPVSETYFNGNGQMELNYSGFAKKTLEYDERNNETKICYFGTDEQLILLPEGYATVLQEFVIFNNGRDVNLPLYEYKELFKIVRR